MAITGNDLERFIPQEEAKPRAAVAQKPLQAVQINLGHEDSAIKEIERTDKREVTREAPRQFKVPALKTKVTHAKSLSKALDYTPKQRKVTHKPNKQEHIVHGQDDRLNKIRKGLGL